MRRTILRFSMMGLAGLSACGGGSDGGDAGVRVDAHVAIDAASESDAGVSLDAASTDDAAASEDAASTDDASVALDAPASDAGASPDTGCTYIDQPYIVFCVEDYEYVREWSAIEGAAACPPYATGTRGDRYATLAEAIAGSACEDACVWRAGRSVSLLRCGRRTGYIEYVASGCASLYETPDGIFRSLEEWDMAAPCP
jgi:hypothetical protein